MKSSTSGSGRGGVLNFGPKNDGCSPLKTSYHQVISHTNSYKSTSFVVEIPIRMPQFMIYIFSKKMVVFILGCAKLPASIFHFNHPTIPHPSPTIPHLFQSGEELCHSNGTFLPPRLRVVRRDTL